MKKTDPNVLIEPFTSVIISNFNGRDFLRECLSSLRKSTFSNFEVIVVDSGSEDGSSEMVRNEFPDVRLIRLGRVGIGTAINVGIQHAKGDIVVFDLNSDDVVHHDWLSTLATTLRRHNYGVVVCGKRYIYGTNLIDSAGARINKLTGSFPPIGGGRPDGPEFQRSYEVDYVPVICTSRKVIESVGLCDEKYEIYFEDTDFCYRAKRKGFKIMYEPDAKFYHHGSATVGKISDKRIYYMFRNRVRFIAKNFPKPFMMISLLSTGWWVVSEFMNQYKLIGRVSNGRVSFLSKYLGACSKAISWNVKHFREILRTRENIAGL